MSVNLAPLFIIVTVLALGPTDSDYLITTPRRWTINANSQVCVALTEGGTFSSADSLRYKLTESRQKGVLRSEADLILPTGEGNSCVDVTVPHSEDRIITLDLSGSLANQPVAEAVNLTFVKETRKTFIQTDKYLYKPGQTVQFRILSVNGPNLDVGTNNYEEVYINNPSRTRIAQWRNVDNSAGLVHLSFDLYDESEEGTYSVGVKLPDKRSEEKIFRVEDYVLPRYKVTIEAPTNILGNDTSVTVKLCARYTFGEPVNGNATLSLAAGTWRIYANLTENKKISGCENFTFPTNQLLFDENNCHIRIRELKARAKVVEDGTGVELHGSNDNINVYRKAIQFKDETPSWVTKPYLPVPVKIATTYPDNKPAKAEKMEVCTSYDDERVCKNFTTSKKGFLSFLMPSQIDSRVEIRAVNYPRIERNWNDVMEESKFNKYRYNSEQYIDATNSSLTVFLENKLQCTTGENINVAIPVIYVVRDQPSADVHIQVISRGQVVAMKKLKVDFTGSDLPFKSEEQLLPLETVPQGVVRGIFEIPMSLPATTSPRIKVLVWYSTADGVVVADSKEVEITDCLPHKVTMGWSENKAEPGTKANLILNAANDALCSIGVVDKSVELLSAQNNKLDIQSILQVAYNSEVAHWDLDQLNLAYCLRKYPTDAGTHLDGPSSSGTSTPKAVSDIIFDRYSMLEAIHMFKNAGYYVISNLVLEKLFCDHLIVQDLKQKVADSISDANANRVVGIVGGGGSHLALAPRPPASSFSAEIIPVDVPDQKEGGEENQERTYLPETWLWLLKPLSAVGELTEPFTLPDTITEWVGRAVCVHPTEGVGISPTSSIITFTTFFVDLTLPSSAKRGEILPIKISVFNYLDVDLPVKVFVEPTEDFQFVEGETGVREICIPSKIKSVETIKVTLSKFGDVNITVEASTQPLSSGSCGSETPPTKKDRFVRSLPVEPEGYPKEKTWTKYICSQDVQNSEGPVDTWVLEAPGAIVEGSERSWITAIGDLMGPTVENIGHLVRLPSGCGEQNMINFAPNIYILQYLEASNQTTEFIRSKITKFLNRGYQRQLAFRHRNGSFSAFGERDKEGSTWLTAFVVKSLAQAKPFTQIDEESLRKSADWLKKLQNAEGCFESRGRVVNKALQGGIKGSGESEPLLTAYVLAAIIEEGNTSKAAISSAVKCIGTDTSHHPFSLALKAYSLALTKDPGAKALIDQLLAAAVSNSSDMRWSLPDRKGENTALHVETAAYALLALVTFNPQTYAEESRKIVRWISGLRNGHGGFISTQDTVVALQALAAFEKAQPKEDLNMVVTASSPDINHAFTVSEENRFLQQRTDVPTLPSTIDLTISGTGCSLVQGVLRYNVLADSRSDAFTLKVETKGTPEKDCKTHHISACTSYTLPDGASNMAIIEVNLISGFIPLKQDLKEVVGDGKGTIKRYEVDGRKVVFYLDEVTAKEVCINFRAYREVEIENAKPGSISVFDYYQPEFISTQKFTFDTQTCPAVV